MNSASLLAFTCPVKTNSGNRALEHLPVELANLNAVKPIIVTGKKAVGRKAIGTLTGAFGDSAMTLGFFDGITDTVDLALIDTLKKTCMAQQYDAIIALGGGTIVDAAKMLNLALSMKTADARRLSNETPIDTHLLPLVVVPTAAADGLETSQYAHFNRMVFSSEYLAPNLVVIDPRLTRAKDGKTIAAAGLAALGRAAEAHISADKNPFREAYSFAAIRFIKENLPAAVNRPGDKKASLAVINAAAMSGCAFSSSNAFLLHKLGQVFHDRCNIHPGVITGMCLTIVLDDCLKKGGHDLSALLRPLAGDEVFVQTPASQRGETALAVLGRFIDELQGMMEEDMPRTLSEAGVPGYIIEDVLDLLSDDHHGPYLCSIIERIWDNKPGRERKG